MFGGSFGGFREGSGTPNYVKICVSQISTDIKKTALKLEPLKKLCFEGHFLGTLEGVAQKNFEGQNCVCSSTTLHKI